MPKIGPFNLMAGAFICFALATGAQSQTVAGPQTAPPAAPAAPIMAPATATPLTLGLQLYQQADYAGALAAFGQAVQQKPNDVLAKVWLGLAEVASGDVDKGIFTLKFATDSIGAWSEQAAELRALTYWQQGETDPAMSELRFCMHGTSAALCNRIKQGIEAGQRPPDISAWPDIVGLVSATQARATPWTP